MAVITARVEFGDTYGDLIFPDFGPDVVTVHYDAGTGLSTVSARPAPVEITLAAFIQMTNEYAIWRREIVRRFAPTWTTIPNHQLALSRSGNTANLFGGMGEYSWIVAYNHSPAPPLRRVVFGLREAFTLDWAQLSVFVESHARLVGIAEKF